MSKRHFAGAAAGLAMCAGAFLWTLSAAKAPTSPSDSAPDPSLPPSATRLAIVKAPDAIDSIAVAGDRVVWIEDPMLYSLPLSGGPQNESRWGDPHDLVADDETLYFLAHPKVMAIRPGDATPRVLMDGRPSLNGLATDETHVYFASTGGPLWRVPKDGGRPQEVDLEGCGCVVGVDETRVYYTATWAGGAPEVPLFAVEKVRFRVNDGMANRPQEGVARRLATGIKFCQATVAATGLYAITARDEIVSIDRETGAVRILADEKGGDTRALTVRRGYLYWATRSAIRGVAEAGGPTTEVVRDVDVKDFTFANDEVVWLGPTGVMRMPIPPQHGTIQP